MSQDPNADPDPERVQRRARERQHERASVAEDIYERVDGFLGERKYPVSSEELAVEYAEEYDDLPNETEALGDALDRLTDERFDTEEEAREAVLGELTGEAGGMGEANEERALGSMEDEGDL